MPSVLAALVSMRKRFACTFSIRFPTPFIVLLLPSSIFALLSFWLTSLAAVLLHKNDSIFSLRFNVICIMCKMGDLLVISVAAVHSVFICWARDFAKHSRRRSNDVVPMLFDGRIPVEFKFNGGDMRGTLFDRRPRCMRSVKRVSSNRFCFDEPVIIIFTV